jgi:hypothetical protein
MVNVSQRRLGGQVVVMLKRGGASKRWEGSEVIENVPLKRL